MIHVRTDKLRASSGKRLAISGVLMETIPDLPCCPTFVTNVKPRLPSQ